MLVSYTVQFSSSSMYKSVVSVSLNIISMDEIKTELRWSGGFFLVCEDFARMFDFFFKVKIRSRTLILLLSPGSVHSGLAS